jgi:hypothetical protein
LFSSLEQNIPGFSLMFVLLTLVFTVSIALREEEVWNTSARLSISPITTACLLGGKLLARLIVGTAQLLLLLLFGHFVYGLRLGHSPVAIVALATAVVASMTCFAAVVASVVRTREQAIPVGLAVVRVGRVWRTLLATLRSAPIDADDLSSADDNLVDVRHSRRDPPRPEPNRSVHRVACTHRLRLRVFPYCSTAFSLQQWRAFVTRSFHRDRALSRLRLLVLAPTMNRDPTVVCNITSFAGSPKSVVSSRLCSHSRLACNVFLPQLPLCRRAPENEIIEEPESHSTS